MDHMNTIALILPWIQLALSIILVALVLLQRGGEGMEGGALGGTSANMTYFSRRGAERFIFTSTIVVAVLFALSALASLIIA